MLDRIPEVEARAASGAPQVQIVDSYADLLPLRSEWQALEARDPEATLFLSWRWLDPVFRAAPGSWRVFVVRSESGDALAILPVLRHVRWNAGAGRLETTLVCAGASVPSAHSGMLLAPGAGAEAVAALVRAVAAQPWADFSMPQQLSPARARRFAAFFPVEDFEARAPGGTGTRPHLVLPRSVETWLQTRVEPELAARIRRARRRDLDTGAQRITITDAASFERDAAIVIAAQRPDCEIAVGAAEAERMAVSATSAMRTALKTDALLLMILWEGDRPIGALAHILDRAAERVHTLCAAGQEATSSPASVLLRSEAIGWAIAHGFAAYDFGPGAAQDAAAYGARDTSPLSLVVTRRTDAEAAILDRASVAEALDTVATLLSEGQLAAAQQATQQLAGLMR